MSVTSTDNHTQKAEMNSHINVKADYSVAQVYPETLRSVAPPGGDLLTQQRLQTLCNSSKEKTIFGLFFQTDTSFLVKQCQALRFLFCCAFEMGELWAGLCLLTLKKKKI